MKFRGWIAAWGLVGLVFVTASGAQQAAEVSAAAAPQATGAPAERNGTNPLAALLSAAGAGAEQAEVDASGAAAPPAAADEATAGPAEEPAVPAAGELPAEQITPPVVRAEEGGAITVNFQDTDIRMALRILSLEGGVNIVATQEVKGTVTATLRNVDFRTALTAVMEITGYVAEERDGVIFVYTRKQYQAIREARRQMATRVFKLDYMTAADAKALVAPALSDQGSMSTTPAAGMGISTSKTMAGGNEHGGSDMLVIRDYEDVLAEVERLLKQMDVRPEQVLIEATLLRATLNEDSALGVDFNGLHNINFRDLNSTSPGLQDVNTGDLDTDELPKEHSATFRTDFTAAVGTGGLTVGFLENDFAFFIRALEGVTDVTVMANPKLLVLNKQRGEVMIGNRDGYLTTTVTETTATQTVEFLETGTRLVVRPYVARDGYIRLELHPEDSSGSVQQIGNNVLPNETTTEVTSNVLVRDGHTIVIGGLFRERTTNGRSQVPFVGNIPYVGTLFRRTSDATLREEVIALVTPRVVRQGPDEAVSEQLRQDAERFRIGQRKGLHWWNRSRLAGTHLRWAKNDLRNNHRGLALWNLDLALSMQPRMAEAIQLKEQLTRRAYWADQPRHSNAKYIVQRMMMEELGRPFERVVPPHRPRRVEQLPADVRESFNIQPRTELPLPGRRPEPPEEQLQAPLQPVDTPSRAPEPGEPGEEALPRPAAETPRSQPAGSAP